MTPKEKSLELIEKYKKHVNPYMGSGMLSNTYDDRAILFQSKKCALIAVDEILHVLRQGHPTELVVMPMDLIDYWFDVKKEIEKI